MYDDHIGRPLYRSVLEHRALHRMLPPDPAVKKHKWRMQELHDAYSRAKSGDLSDLWYCPKCRSKNPAMCDESGPFCGDCGVVMDIVTEHRPPKYDRTQSSKSS